MGLERSEVVADGIAEGTDCEETAAWLCVFVEVLLTTLLALAHRMSRFGR